MKEAFWKPVINKSFRTNPKKRHNAICPYCGSKNKNINLHYRKYHPETIEKLTDEFGEIYGIRFITTSGGSGEPDGQAASGSFGSSEPN